MRLTREILKIHVVHYTPLVKRGVHLRRELVASGMEALAPEWILEHDREAISAEDLERLVKREPTGAGAVTGGLNGGHVSVILKHLAAFEKAAVSEVPFHLVLEDDVFIDPGWRSRMEMQLKALPEDWEILFVGDGCGLRIPWWRRWMAGKALKQAGVFFRGWKAVWWGGGGMSRCAAGYVIRPASARRFLESIHAQPPFEVPIDWLMNRVGVDLTFRSFWAEPAWVRQGAFESWTKGEG